MTSSNPGSQGGAAVDAAFEEYLCRIDAGERVDIPAFLKEHPECAEELRLAIEAEQSARAIGGPVLLSDGQNDKSSSQNGRLDDATRIAAALDDDSTSLTSVSLRPNWELPNELGDYQLLQPVAQGGMGVVFKARQKSLGRLVAVKLMLQGWIANETAVERFQSEAKLASRLQHPHIVAIYEVGEQDGRFYFSMEFVSGRNLLEILRENPLSPNRAAEIMACVSEAMEYAHLQGLLHRDLKPSNILIDEQKRPKITDFGLACAVGDVSDLTRTGEILGTASYMSPEQAMGLPSSELTPATDVYSLGAVLYALLVGHPPFQADRSLDTLLQVREQEPIPPRKLNAKIPRDLDTICLKCLAKSPHERYQSAQELADDLNRFREGEPIRARPASVMTIAWRWCRRHRAAALGMGLSAVFLVIMVIGVLIYGIQTDRLNDELTDSNAQLTDTRGELLDSEAQLKTALDESLATQRQLRESLYAADIREAGHAYQVGDYRAVVHFLNEPIAAAGETDLRGPEWRLLHNLVALPHIRLEGHVGDVHSVEFSQDGRWLASGGKDTTLRIYHAETLESHARLKTGPAAVRGVAFDPSGEYVAAACFDGNVHVYEIESKQSRNTIKAHPDQAWDVAWTPDGESLITCGKEDLWVRLWEPLTGKPLAPLGPHESGRAVRQLAITGNGRWLASTCSRTYRLWDLKTGKAVISHTEPSRVTSVAFSPDDQFLSYATLTGHVYQRPCDSSRTPPTLGGRHDDAVESLAVSRDGRFRASVDRGGVLAVSRILEEPTKSTKRETPSQRVFGHEGRALTVAFSPDSKRVVTAGQDGVLRVWKIDDLDLPSRLTLPRGVGCLAYHKDGSIIASSDQRIVRWNPRTGTHQDLATKNAVTSIAVSPDSRHFAVGTVDAKVSLWDLAAGKLVNEVQIPELDVIGDLEFTADDAWLIARHDHELLILDRETLEKREGFEKVRSNSVTVSPDGKTLAFSRKDVDNIELWNLETLERINTFPGHGATVESLRFSQDGKWIASGSGDRLIKIWRVEDGKLSLTLSGHRGGVSEVDFSPDGRRLFSAGRDGTLRVWSVPLGQEILTLRGNEEVPNQREHGIRMSPDGNSLVHNRLGTLFSYELTGPAE